jgi:6-methylsalicylate decarboxylase
MDLANAPRQDGLPAVPVISPRAVDVHAHFLPRSYREALHRAGIKHPDGFPFVPEWSAVSALGLMDHVGIEAALLSISSPALSFVEPTERAELARTVNQEGAAAVREAPHRFGLLSSLPLPDVGAALAEVSHASEELGADGFVLMTNYDGVYLGDETFQPVLEELDRRGAVVLVHPTSPPSSEAVALGLPRPVMEFIFDTTRAVAQLVLNGTLKRHPRLKVIVPHVGSALPSLADRLSGYARVPFVHGPSEEIDVEAELARLYYDVAGTPFPHALRGLLGIARPDHLLYASDTPFTPAISIERAGRALVETDVLDEQQKAALLTTNAAPLFPRFARTPAANTA